MIPDYAWIGAAALVGALEALAIWFSRDGRDHGTLTRFVRRVFRTNTRVGRIVFVVAWVAFSGWVLYHIAFEETTWAMTAAAV